MEAPVFNLGERESFESTYELGLVFAEYMQWLMQQFPGLFSTGEIFELTDRNKYYFSVNLADNFLSKIIISRRRGSSNTAPMYIPPRGLYLLDRDVEFLAYSCMDVIKLVAIGIKHEELMKENTIRQTNQILSRWFRRGGMDSDEYRTKAIAHINDVIEKMWHKMLAAEEEV